MGGVKEVRSGTPYREIGTGERSKGRIGMIL
jgi:hypothetical protein